MPTIALPPRKPKPKRNVTDAKREAQKVYNSKRWKLLRAAYIQAHPLCEICLQEGRTTAAEHVHHVTPFRKGKTALEREQLAFDGGNLQALCRECHEKEHDKLKKWWK